MDLYTAASKIHNVLKYDHSNQIAENLKQEINNILKKYDGPITEWLRKNARSHRAEIDILSDGLYFKLNQLENNLIFDEFITIDSLTLELLDIFCEQINYQSSDIDSVVRRMKVSIRNAVNSVGLL